MNGRIHRWASSHQTNIELTLARMGHGSHDPTHRLDRNGGVWRTTLNEDGPATLHLTQTSTTDLVATAWGPGSDRALADAPGLLGIDDDPTEFRPQHPLLERAHHQFPGLRIPRTGRVLEVLIPAILEQRVVGIQAIGSWRRLVTQFGGRAPGPAPEGMRVLPSADVWTRIPSWEWHRAEVDAKRAQRIVAVARLAPSIERLALRSPAEALAGLLSVPGVGVWTAAETAQRAFGDRDAISVGDHHLARMIGHSLFGTPFTDAEMVTALEPWRPQRYRVARLLFALGLETAPAHGPRSPLTRNRDR